MAFDYLSDLLYQIRIWEVKKYVKLSLSQTFTFVYRFSR